jgi:hypothetical protein
MKHEVGKYVSENIPDFAFSRGMSQVRWLKGLVSIRRRCSSCATL